MSANTEIPSPDNLTQAVHPLLSVVQAYLCLTVPPKSWAEGDCLALGIANTLEPQWLTVTLQAHSLVFALTNSNPQNYRGALVMTAEAADGILSAQTSRRGISPDIDTYILGDGEFISQVLDGCFQQHSPLGVRQGVGR